LPGLLAGHGLSTIMMSMLNEIGGGIIAGLFFICLFEYSGSLLVPIMVHALFDYSYQWWGIIIGLVVFFYLIITSRKFNLKILK
jgi:membrane protease YdiL (CAAX protease family)